MRDSLSSSRVRLLKNKTLNTLHYQGQVKQQTKLRHEVIQHIIGKINDLIQTEEPRLFCTRLFTLYAWRQWVWKNSTKILSNTILHTQAQEQHKEKKL